MDVVSCRRQAWGHDEFESEDGCEVDDDSSGGDKVGGVRGAASICIRGIRSGVSSSSAQPPLNPISTTRSNIRANSSFLMVQSIIIISKSSTTTFAQSMWVS